MRHDTLLLFVIALFSISYAEKLPPEYKTCKESDPNASACFKDAIEDALLKLENGIPSLNIPPLQPLNIPSVTIGEGKGAVNVVQNYENFNLYDIGKSKIEKIDYTFTPNDLKLELELFTPETRFEADYSLNGRLLLLPIEGKGKCTVKLQQLKTKLNIYAETFEKKGIKYLKVKDFIMQLTPGKVVFNFENLFNGDERLGGEINKLLNDNWNEVFSDIKEPYTAAMQTVFADYANKILTKIPYDEIH